jgi:hypothetical protein
MTGTSISPTRLPKARALTEALVAPPTVELGEEPTVLYRQLAGALCAAATGLPPGTSLRVDGYFFRMALTTPEHLSHPDPFEWSPRTARRLLGLAAVRACVSGSERTPAAAVEQVVSAAVEDARRGQERSGSLAGWLSDLAWGGRAVVRAEAVTWATQLLAALEWRSLGSPPVVGSDQWWDGPAGCRVALRGRSEVRVATAIPDRSPAALRPTSQAPALFAMLGGRPSPVAALELGLAALASFMARPHEPSPARVIGWWPQCGRAMVLPVDAPTLRNTADSVVAAIAAYGAVCRGRAGLDQPEQGSSQISPGCLT